MTSLQVKRYLESRDWYQEYKNEIINHHNDSPEWIARYLSGMMYDKSLTYSSFSYHATGKPEVWRKREREFKDWYKKSFKDVGNGANLGLFKVGYIDGRLVQCRPHNRFMNCMRCAFKKQCDKVACNERNRPDGKNVIFINYDI